MVSVILYTPQVIGKNTANVKKRTILQSFVEEKERRQLSLRYYWIVSQMGAMM